MDENYLYNYLTMFVIYIIASIILQSFMFSCNYIPILDNIQKTCLARCSKSKCFELIQWSRGKNYLVEDEIDRKESIKSTSTCLITFYSFTHLVLYFILGYLVPSLYLESFFIGIIFEFWERYNWDAHDFLDPVYNGIGLLLGMYFSPYRNK